MFAARAFDPTLHGGFIAFGEPTVLIGGLPAARIGDPHVCPLTPPLLPPHVGGWVSSGSLTVLVGGKGAARQTDLCACCVLPVSVPSIPSDPPDGGTPRPEGLPEVEFLHSHEEDVDADGDGEADLHKRKYAGVRAHEEQELWGFFRRERETLGAYYENEYTTKKSEVTGDHHLAGGKHEAGYGKDTTTYEMGNEESPLVEIETKSKVLSAEASAVEPLIGTDGRGRYGLGGEFGGKGSAASQAVKVKTDAAMFLPLTPVALAAREFAGVNADMTGSASVSEGSVGVVGGGWLYYENGRVNWSLKGKIGIGVVGVSFEVGASAGVMEGRSLLDYFRDDPVTLDPVFVQFLIDQAKALVSAHLLATVPNTIAMGCPNVLIGS
jgi:uncharacterized Zn-binding protein involved in type VI secretion